jgi:hypothetical protein
MNKNLYYFRNSQFKNSVEDIVKLLNIHFMIEAETKTHPYN